MSVPTRLSTAFFLLAGTSFLLSACGNRGPLTLPPKDISAQAAATVKPLPDHSNTPSSGKQ